MRKHRHLQILAPYAISAVDSSTSETRSLNIPQNSATKRFYNRLTALALPLSSN